MGVDTSLFQYISLDTLSFSIDEQASELWQSVHSPIL